MEIDLVNTTTGGTVDAQATTGLGYTVTSTGTTSTNAKIMGSEKKVN